MAKHGLSLDPSFFVYHEILGLLFYRPLGELTRNYIPRVV